MYINAFLCNSKYADPVVINYYIMCRLLRCLNIENNCQELDTQQLRKYSNTIN